MEDLKIIEKQKKSRGWNLDTQLRVWMLNIAIGIFVILAGFVATHEWFSLWQRVAGLVMVVVLGWIFAANNNWWSE